jgi:hypothetical protein
MSSDSRPSFRSLSAFTLVLAEAPVVVGVFETAAGLVATGGVVLVEVLVFAGTLALAEVLVSAVALLLVVAQPLSKNPKSNDNRIEGLTVRVIFELI